MSNSSSTANPRKRIGTVRSDGETFSWSVSVEIPSPVHKVWKSGYSIFPQTGGEPKRPLCEWKDYQERPITREELCDVLATSEEPGTWALATGHATGLVVLDFDGRAGRKLCRKWKLKANVISRNDGRHVWVKDVPVPVKTGHVAGWPGLELKGERASVTFFGAVTEGPKKGEYQLKSTEPVSIHGLPFELRNLIMGQEETEGDRRLQAAHTDTGEASPDIASVCLTRALTAVQQVREGWEDRNVAGFSLFCQMRDNRVPEHTAFKFIPLWVSLMNDLIPKPDDPYSEREAVDSLEQAYREPAREPSISRVLTDVADDLIRFSDVEVTKVHWFWQSRIAFGKLTIIDGDPEKGKSLITIDLAARFTQGKPMPDGEYPGQGNVLMVVAEDAPGDTLVPRFLAAGGDPERIFYYPLPTDPETGRVRPLTIPEDLDAIEQRIQDHDIRYVIVDPISAFLSESISSHNDASVRRALTPLAAMAEINGCAMVLVRHLNKDSGESKALYRGGGSIAFAGAARSVMVVGDHPEEPGIRVLARVKNNLAKPVPSLTYSIEPCEEDPDVIRIVWHGPCDLTADDLFRKKDARMNSPERDEAVRFLRTELEEGPRPAKEIEAAAKDAGISKSTLKRARSGEVVAFQDRDENTGAIIGWKWALIGTEYKGEIISG